MGIVDHTICAPATPAGSGAISIVRLSGKQTFEIVDKVVRFRVGCASEYRGGSVHFGELLDHGTVVDEVLVSIFRAPHSYTGEDCAEISCHASSYIVSRMLELLCDAGARMAEPGEFTRRAFLAGKMDLSQAEAVADVIAANSQASLRVAMNQLKGAYSSELRELRNQLVELASLMELELDFSEEEVEFADRSKLRELLARTQKHIVGLVESFRLGNAIRNGVPVAIIGAVNAGKSTLLNALVGHDRAIVSDTPGTTRDTVEELFNVGGLQLRLIDTAGLRETDDSIEKIGIERSVKASADAEIVIGVVDATRPKQVVTAEIQTLKDMVNPDRQKFVIALNKMDLLSEASSDVCSQGDLFPVPLPCRDVKCCCISAAKGEIVELRTMLDECCRELSELREDATLVTNLRHYEALRRALSYLETVASGLSLGIPTDLVAEDLRSAISELNSIFGEASIDTESLLSQIFSRFCVGK